MEHIAALLLLVGCSDNLAECRELPAPVPLYETSEECGTALPFTRSDALGAMPRVFATCVSVDPAMAEEDAELVWDVTPEGNLVAEVNFAPEFGPEQAVASLQPETAAN